MTVFWPWSCACNLGPLLRLQHLRDTERAPALQDRGTGALNVPSLNKWEGERTSAFPSSSSFEPFLEVYEFVKGPGSPRPTHKGLGWWMTQNLYF